MRGGSGSMKDKIGSLTDCFDGRFLKEGHDGLLGTLAERHEAYEAMGLN